MDHVPFTFIGLGNPGKKYENTPHNAGFLCIDELCRLFSLELKKMGKLLQGIQGQWEGEKITLAKPMTYMNLSGNAVCWLVDYFRLPLSSLFVIYDDVDLPLGNIRIRERGSAGSHKGMKSIVQALGTQEFARIRIGIAPEENPRNHNLVDYVLTPLSKKEQPFFRQGIQSAVEAVQTVITKGLEKTMNEFNRRTNSLLLQRG